MSISLVRNQACYSRKLLVAVYNYTSFSMQRRHGFFFRSYILVQKHTLQLPSVPKYLLQPSNGKNMNILLVYNIESALSPFGGYMNEKKTLFRGKKMEQIQLRFDYYIDSAVYEGEYYWDGFSEAAGV